MRATSHSIRLPRPSSTLLRIGAVAQQLGVTPQTIRNWIKQGELDCVRTAGNQRLITEASVRRYLGFDEEEENAGEVPIALVSRVSTNRQGKGYSSGEGESDLTRQEDRLKSWAKENHPESNPVVYSRIASGMNFEHPTFLRLINDILDGKFRNGFVVVVHSERLCRFGLDLVKELIRRGGAELVVLEEGEDESDDLASDILAVVSHFGAVYHGRRAGYTNTKHVSDECVKRMIELRQEGFPIDQIVRTLNREGFTQQKKNGKPERVTERIVLRYLDSNGIQKALEVAVGVSEGKKRPVEEFLATRLVKTGKAEDRAFNKDIREAYVRWAKGKKVEIETPTNLGKLIVGMGFQRGKDCKGNRYYRGVKLAG